MGESTWQPIGSGVARSAKLGTAVRHRAQRLDQDHWHAPIGILSANGSNRPQAVRAGIKPAAVERSFTIGSSDSLCFAVAVSA